MSRKRAILLIFMLFLSSSGWSLDLYQGEALVPAQDEDSRAAGVAAALKQVVVKVSGDRQADSNAAVLAALPEAAKLMQRYEYRQELVRGADGKPQVNLYLIASFYQASIDQLLQRSRLAVWGRERPTVLVLVADGEHLLDAAGAPELQQRARSRGLELSFPSDLELSADELSSLQQGRLGGIAQRFGGGHVLAGALSEGGGRFVVDDGLTSRSFTVSAPDRSSALLQLADQSLTVLAQIQTGAGSEPIDVVVWVEGVDSAAGYARVLSVLGGLTPVKSVRVQGVEQAGLKLEMTVLGGAERLQQTVALGSELSMPSVDPAVLTQVQ